MFQCMLDTWDLTIFEGIRQNLEDSAMKLVQKEREGSAINSALVIGVRESCGMHTCFMLFINLTISLVSTGPFLFSELVIIVYH